ncbi:phosphotransferase enzyme family protein [Ophiobolus disseminans]|uniref:Altered inheritance of mitochondria protein 9, mitochondrial n=1 Tax=Ophiobolus disseminans TaxID=1469910 RepID=A0A6A6ZQU4_9PLEO|nr:phosphotransferase enzyme family protein [Ophiobolus disseminans]
MSTASMRAPPIATDWNSHDDLFREAKFVLNELASVAANSVGATRCIDIVKFSDGLFNKAFLMSMDNGQEIVAKVLNPNAGMAHFTTASEVGTMDFVKLWRARRVLDTPVPRVHTWNSHAQSHPVGAEFIIMEKTEGVPLSLVWDKIELDQRLNVLLDLVSIQKRWLSVSFSHYGGLYYAKDVQPSPGFHYVKDRKVINDPVFASIPAPGREVHYLKSIGTRETKATRELSLPKQMTMFYGPKLYRPDAQAKLTALGQYQNIVDALIPHNTPINDPYLWHNDLHRNNIFSCDVMPLFSHDPDPGLLHWSSGPEPMNLDLPPKPKLSGLSAEEQDAAMREYSHVFMFIAWRKLVQFWNTLPAGLINLASRMFEYGEAHFQSGLVDLKHTWKGLPAGAGNTPFPFEFSDREVDVIKANGEYAVNGVRLKDKVKENMGHLWPSSGSIPHELYDECRATLQEVKEFLIKGLADNEEERAEI